MAFDSGMVAAVAYDLNRQLSGGKIEKIFFPEKDEINIVIRSLGKSRRLLITTGSNCPRVCITSAVKENPSTPPMFCMLLRKHLQGGRLTEVRQIGFDRVLEFRFTGDDEMGFASEKYLYVEIMGRNSNTVFCDGQHKVLACFRTTDISSSSSRALLPGMKYTLPPAQDKLNPLETNYGEFSAFIAGADREMPAYKFLLDRFQGLSSLTAREIVFRAAGDCDISVGEIDVRALADEMSAYAQTIKSGGYSPCLMYKKDEDCPFEYSFFEIKQYGAYAKCERLETVSEVIDTYFSVRDRNERKRQHFNDISTMLKNSEARLKKKISLQKNELLDSEKAEECKLCGDLIIQEIHRIHRGDEFIDAIDYTREDMPNVRVKLDSRLTPSQNAQKYYKEYSKKKAAKIMLAKQIELAEQELMYIASVYDSLMRAETDDELNEIREELSEWGYGKKMSSCLKKQQKKKKFKIQTVVTPNGYKLLIGKNNLQNDYITTVLGEKNDYWFHIKNYPGSHVVMVTGGEEPPSEDFTFAAETAAKNSKADEHSLVAVDYTLIRYIRKPAGAKPGFVVYDKYWTAYVKT